MGQLYLTNVDFLKNGVPASVIAALVCFIRPLFKNHSPYGTIGGRIAWLYADEGCWVRVMFPCFLSPRLSPVQKHQLTLRSGWINPTMFGVLRPGNAALQPRWRIRSPGS